jgi:ech hydrogenase subunit B
MLQAHQEIVGGVEVEYSGVFFEFLYMAKWIEYIFIYMLVFLFAGDNIILGIVLCLIVFILVNLVDNATARVKINHLVKIALIIGLVLSIFKYIWNCLCLGNLEKNHLGYCTIMQVVVMDVI